MIALTSLHAAGEASDGPWTTWSSDAALVIVLAVAAAVVYLAGWRRLRRRGRTDLARVWHAAAALGGLTIIVLALVSPLDHVGEEYLLVGHMAQHLLVGDIGAILIVAALVGPLALFAVPRPVLRSLGRRRPVRAVIGFLGRPATAVVVWCAVMLGWHYPPAYELALHERWVHDLEHASMILAGVLAWAVILGVGPHRRLSPARRAGVAGLLFGVGLVVSQALLLSGPLYDVYVDQPERLFGLTPEGDQTRAALLMGAEQLMTLGLAAGMLLWTHVERVAGATSP